jgi:hypothetical protein
MKRNNEIRITLILDIIILTTLLVVSANASLEDEYKFQIRHLSLVDRFHSDHNKIIR